MKPGANETYAKNQGLPLALNANILRWFNLLVDTRCFCKKVDGPFMKITRTSGGSPIFLPPDMKGKMPAQRAT